MIAAIIKENQSQIMYRQNLFMNYYTSNSATEVHVHKGNWRFVMMEHSGN